VVFPVDDPALRDRIVNQILAAQLADNVKASLLGSDGMYHRPPVKKDSKGRSSQAEFMTLALGESKARRSGAGRPNGPTPRWKSPGRPNEEVISNQ